MVLILGVGKSQGFLHLAQIHPYSTMLAIFFIPNSIKKSNTLGWRAFRLAGSGMQIEYDA